MENAAKKPPTTLVEQVVQHADMLTGQVKQLQVLYYQNVIRVAEQELGLSIEKKSVTK